MGRTLAQSVLSCNPQRYADSVLQSTYSTRTCSLARALEVVGERWTLLVVRELFIGVRRFDAIQQDLGVARNVLATRLDKLVDEGIVVRVPYSERPLRHEYRLTEAGIDLWPVVVSLLQWGDKHVPDPGGPPVVLEHRDCGGAVDDHFCCTACGARLDPRTVVPLPGPGAGPEHPLLRRR
jgi:DNA-binding HxlR family transcriptional regulator